MAKARAIIKRRRAVQNIRKITHTMQLIATARYQKCLQHAAASKPYADKITEIVETLSSSEAAEHPLLRANEGAQRSILLTVASNRGLCGAYNASVLRVAIEHKRQLAEQGITPDMEMIGKKGASYLRFLGVKLAARITDIEDEISFSRAAEMAERYMRAYVAGAVARVDIAYTQYHSVGVQRPTVTQLLPIEPPRRAEQEEQRRRRREFEFSPPPVILLGRLIPQTVRIRLRQYVSEALLSEQVARMVAMKAATDAGGDMIKYLTRQYNRARQTQVTLELADIVGGSEAVR
jgi:F-type H+-transporting ATPase subunit gamma